MQNYSKFIDKASLIAIVGATEDREKWGFKLTKKLADNGYKVLPVNPKYDTIYDLMAYSSLFEINKKVDIVLTVVPPQVTIKVIESCIKLGINNIWMQPGSESDEAVQLCEQNNINYISNACFVVDGMKEGF